METAPKYLNGAYCDGGGGDGDGGGGGSASVEQFTVENLLDLSIDDDDDAWDNGTVEEGRIEGNSMQSCVTAVESINSSFSGFDIPFPVDLIDHYDELQDLEWLSSFVEESLVEQSLSTNDLENLHIITGMKCTSSENLIMTRTAEPNENGGTAEPNENKVTAECNENGGLISDTNGGLISDTTAAVPVKMRSKLSRAAPRSWSSRLLALSAPAASESSSSASPRAFKKKKDAVLGASYDGRRCLHCETDKTPQWRTGPMGPKTLCNACGVRYKSGRLMPEYRPAASPTFSSSEHSNSHRKVIELRRQKELHFHNHHLHHQSFFYDCPCSATSAADEYLIEQRIGPDFRHLI